MKYSLYNNIIPLTESALLIYAAMQDKFIAVANPSFSSLPERPETLKGTSPKLYEQLVACGGIIEDDVDEIEMLKQRIHDIDYDDSEFILHVNPTLDCNLNCWYCYENHVKGSRMTDALAESAIRFASDKIATMPNLKRFCLSFFGGEPLLAMNIVERLSANIKSECDRHDVGFSLSFTTNGVLLNDDIIKSILRYSPSFQITIDGNQSSHDKTRFEKGGIPTYERILDNIKRILSNNLSVILRINFTHDNIDGVAEIFPFIESLPDSQREYLSVDLQRVWQDNARERDDVFEEARNLRYRIRGLGVKVLNSHLLHGVEDPCYGDKLNNLLINYNGDLFRCTARDFKTEHRLGFLDENGNCCENEDRRDEWMQSKLSKPICQTCRIAPLCGGGCRRQAVDHKGVDRCMFNYSEDYIDQFIIDRFQDLHQHK